MAIKDDLVERGSACMDTGKFEDALALFERALSHDDSDPDLWNHLGVALRSLGRYDESARCFERSLQLDPRDRNSS